MDNDHTDPESRTPEEELQYQVANRLRLRDKPPTEEDRHQVIDRIFEEDHELFQLLADS